jgi:PAS domain S-box-containing protein
MRLQERPHGAMGSPVRSPRIVEMSVAVTDWEGRPACMATMRDVTAPASTREALRLSEAKLRRLVDSSLVGIFFSDPGWVIRDANDAFLHLVGYDRADLAAGVVTWERLSPPEFRNVVKQVERDLAATGVSNAYEKMCLRKDGRRVWSLVAAATLGDGGGSVAFLVDIDQRKAAEEALRKKDEQLRQSQKMEAVGRLAGGVAHDFNNLLTAINGYSEIMLDSMEAENPHRSSVEEIRKAGEKAATLTKQLLTFSRKQVVVPKILDANAVVTDMVNLIRRLIGENIDLQVVLEPDAGRFKADAALVQQVVLNLAINSRDAMPKGGRLEIRTSRAEIGGFAGDGEAGAGFHLKAAPGRYVSFSVRDTGWGMDDSVRSHLFEPFFSTKEKGKGTGLGLSTVYGIVKQFDGAIKVETLRGSGTVITVYLPRVEAQAGGDIPAGVPEAATYRGKETLLLVEDEEAVRRMTRSILEEKGYAVFAAADGSEALEFFETSPERADLLLTDIIMPGMSGRELAERLREVRPGLRVVFISGYTDDAAVQKEVLDPGTAFLAKPFTTSALLRTVREALDAAAPQGVSPPPR